MGMLLFSGCQSTSVKPKRFGSVIGLKDENLKEYKELHANTWPEILKNLEQSNIQNYSIYLTKFDDNKYYLFSYFEYVGSDFPADMKKIGDDPLVKKWWKLTEPMQNPLKNRAKDEHWKNMEEVFHMD